MSTGLAALTLLHVVISLIGIVSGLVVTYGLLRSHILGAISLVLLAFAIAGHYKFQLAGAWRRVCSVTAVLSLWLNGFVLIAQLFMKVPALHPLAPTGSKPPFLISQTVVMIAFIAVLSAKKFGGDNASPA